MKKILACTLALVLALSLFTACGTQTDDKTITIAASATPHAEILEIVKQELAKDGWTLKITIYTDYVQPNIVVDDGECDANYFQHKPYLDTFNAENGTHLVSVAAVHYEPFGIYAGKKSDLSALSADDTIIIPNDGSNRARALLLLEAQGIIKLREGVGMDATANDIIDEQSKLPKANITEMEAAQIAGLRDDASFAVINGNYALAAGLNVSKDALASEDAASVSATTYANILCVKEGNEQSEKTLALIKALNTDAVRNYINESYNGAVVPLF